MVVTERRHVSEDSGRPCEYLDLGTRKGQEDFCTVGVTHWLVVGPSTEMEKTVKQVWWLKGQLENKCSLR